MINLSPVLACFSLFSSQFSSHSDREIKKMARLDVPHVKTEVVKRLAVGVKLKQVLPNNLELISLKFQDLPAKMK